MARSVVVGAEEDLAATVANTAAEAQQGTWIS